MITKHKLLVDKDCPMCKLYGQCFVKYKMIDEQSLTYYQDEAHTQNEDINMKRAKSEIAFYDEVKKETVYGIDALIKIFNGKFPLMASILKHRWIHFLIKKIYFLISYNRKQIAPVALSSNTTDCSPEVSLPNRWTYILGVALITALILDAFYNPIFTALYFPHILGFEIIVCFGQIIWQGLAVSFIDPKNKLDYLGNMSTVSLLGGLLLLPLIFLNQFIPIYWFLQLWYFAVVVFIMVLEHIRRCQLLGISHWMTVSWIMYRIVILGVGFILFK